MAARTIPCGTLPPVHGSLPDMERRSGIAIACRNLGGEYPSSLAQKAASTSETPEPTRTPPSRQIPQGSASDVSPKSDRPWENESPHMNAAIPEGRPVTEEISGLIERVTFHNDDSGFCVP